MCIFYSDKKIVRIPSSCSFAYAAGSVLVSEVVGGCARKVRAFVRRQSDTIVTGTRNVARRASSALADDYVPKNFADNVRHRFRRLLKLTAGNKSADETTQAPKTNGKAAENEFSLQVIKRMFVWRRSDRETESVADDEEMAERKDVVAMNFESTAGVDSGAGHQNDAFERTDDGCNGNARTSPAQPE